MKLNFLLPRMLFFSNLEQLFKDESNYFFQAKPKELSDIIAAPYSLVLAEPGYGKSRLLKEIVRNSEAYGKKSIYVDLKRMGSGTVEEYIFRHAHEFVDANSKEIEDEAKLRECCYLKSSPVSITSDSNNLLICFDALDEVKPEELSAVIDMINSFYEKHPRISGVISCRKHHSSKLHTLKPPKGALFVQLLPFSQYQSESYLHNLGVSPGEVRRIFDSLQFRNREAIIQVPRYLYLLAELIVQKGVEHIKGLTRDELFEKFIYGNPMAKEASENAKNIELIKRVLEKLALIMEIYQSNLITKDEMMTFFDEIDSNLCISFLEQVPIRIFYERCLLKETGDTVEFENVEFQEYLAAKEIGRFGKIDQIAFELVISQEQREIHPSWFNTLRFLVDIRPALLKPILELRSLYSQTENPRYHQLLTSINSCKLSATERREIFYKVFNYYTDSATVQYGENDIFKNLSYFYDESLENNLRSVITDDFSSEAELLRKTNLCSFVAIIADQLATTKPFWLDTLVKFVHLGKPGLQCSAVWALGKFGDLETLKKVWPVFQASQDEIFDQRLIAACNQIDPNDPFSIDCSIIGITRDNIFSRYGICAIKSKAGITQLIQALRNDPVFFKKFVEDESIFKQDADVIAKNITAVSDESIVSELKQLIHTVCFSQEPWQATESISIIAFSKIVSKAEPEYIFELIEKIATQPSSHLHEFVKIFAEILVETQIERFIRELEKFKARRIAVWVLHASAIPAVKEAGRQYFPEEYRASENQSSTQKNEDRQSYEEFRKKLPRNGRYQADIFAYYARHHEKINRYMKQPERNMLTAFTLNFISTVCPYETELRITSKSDNTTSFTQNQAVSIFGEALRTARILGVDLGAFRKNIFSYIAFADPDELKDVFHFIPNPTRDEFNDLINTYGKTRKDDLARFRPKNLIEAVIKFNVREAVPVLQMFVDETANYDEFVKIEALNALASLGADEEYFQAVFANCRKNSTPSQQLMEVSNELLISMFFNDAAIRWRLNEVKNRLLLFEKKKGCHVVGPIEEEIRNKNFAGPLMNLRDPKYKADFLALLDKAFELRKKDGNCQENATYLCDVVFSYYSNLKELRSYNHIVELEKYSAEKCSSVPGSSYWFYKLKELKNIFLTYIGKPASISTCVRKYNELKSRELLDIYSAQDLFQVILDVIKHDCKRWVEDEGAYKIIHQSKYIQETLIQKTLLSKIENGLLSRGLRNSGIIRESQLLDDDRTDFLIFHGFIGPILLELKRVDNKQVIDAKKRIAYRSKLLEYMSGTNSSFGIILLFQINKKASLQTYLPKVREVYADLPNVRIEGLNCIK